MGRCHADRQLTICERRHEPIHLVLTDVVMPHTSGPQLVARLAKVLPGVKALFMSGHTDEVVVHHGVRDRSAHFIQKPFSPEALAGKVHEVLAGTG